MSFKWSEYLILADTLYLESKKFPHEEACFRAAISRAYYAAFCEARNRARGEDLPLDGTAADHDRVASYYDRSPNDSRKKVGILLRRLRRVRNKADYADTMNRPDLSCETSRKEAREVFECLNKP